jgi:hypothetical protein
LDQVQQFGFGWLDEVYRLIMEDRRDNYLMAMSLLPVARTPMEEKGSRWLSNYMRDLRRSLFEMTPWDRVQGSIRSAYRGKVKSGTIAVVLDDPRLKDDPMFKGAKVVKK